jgi:hypothetical protein
MPIGVARSLLSMECTAASGRRSRPEWITERDLSRIGIARTSPVATLPRELERMWRWLSTLHLIGVERSRRQRQGGNTVNTSYVPGRTAESTATGTLGAAMAPPVVGVATAPRLAVDVDAAAPRDRVRWGPVLAGIVTAFAVLLFLTVIGIAIGITALNSSDTNPRNWGTAAGIWGGLTLLVAFFIGGWVAGRSAAPTLEVSGLLNGFVTGAASLLLLVWLTTTAVTGALGFFATTVADIAGAAAPAAVQATNGNVPTVDQTTNAANAVVPDQADQAARQAAQAAQQNAEPGAWGTAIALALAIIAAMLGGKAGQEDRLALPGSRVAVVRS